MTDLGRAAEARPARAPEDLAAARRVLALARALAVLPAAARDRPRRGRVPLRADGRAVPRPRQQRLPRRPLPPARRRRRSPGRPRVLNTNTRYLHDGARRATRDRLAAELPEPLSVVLLVNSGSEANDLALRLARAHTGRSGVLVPRRTPTTATPRRLIDISPYKFDGRGGAGRRRTSRSCADPGPLPRRVTAPTGPRYAAADVAAPREARARRGAPPAAFLAESLPGCAGQIVLPAGLPRGRRIADAREAGAVCIADEVQVGFGRVGTALLGLRAPGRRARHRHHGQADRQRPPARRGRDDAARSPRRSPTGWSTSTPSAATRSRAPPASPCSTCMRGRGPAGARRPRVGGRLLAGLRELADRHPLVGDVRGRGLFLGVELVRDRETREPASRTAADARRTARGDAGVLSEHRRSRTTTCIKIKPPLVVSADDCAFAVEVLDRGAPRRRRRGALSPRLPVPEPLVDVDGRARHDPPREPDDVAVGHPHAAVRARAAERVREARAVAAVQGDRARAAAEVEEHVRVRRQVQDPRAEEAARVGLADDLVDRRTGRAASASTACRSRSGSAASARRGCRRGRAGGAA